MQKAQCSLKGRSGLTNSDIELWEDRRKLDKECLAQTELAMLRVRIFRSVQCVYSYHKFSIIVTQKISVRDYRILGLLG